MQKPPTSYYWFDYETFGTHPAWDRPCQFAGIRTDMQLNVIGDPLMIYCKQANDYLPHPQACKVTGIAPQDVNRDGICEAEFINRILDEIGKPGTCSVGYNSIRFDDEFTRHTLFRNFFDSYEYEWKDGNTRWDLLDIVRLTRALRPEGIHWPVNADGSASNKLEHLSQANAIEHADAHDALSDVMATIGIARLIKTAQPKLFDFAFSHRDKQSVSAMLNTKQRQPCLHVSGMIPGIRHHISAILPLMKHREKRNSVIVLDLHQDPTPLLSLSAEEIEKRLYQSSDQAISSGLERPGLRTIQINKCPVVVPFSTLGDEDANRLTMDKTSIAKHQQIAEALFSEERLSVISTAMSRQWPEGNQDVDGSLYTGSFLSAADRKRSAELRKLDPKKIEAHAAHFEDKRLIEMAWRYQGRNFPESLDSEQQSRWKEHCQQRLNSSVDEWLDFSKFNQELTNCEWSKEELPLRQSLMDYASALKNWLESPHTMRGQQ